MATSIHMPVNAVKNLLVTKAQGSDKDNTALTIYVNIVSNNMSLTFSDISYRVQSAFSSGIIAIFLYITSFCVTCQL